MLVGVIDGLHKWGEGTYSNEAGKPARQDSVGVLSIPDCVWRCLHGKSEPVADRGAL